LTGSRINFLFKTGKNAGRTNWITVKKNGQNFCGGKPMIRKLSALSILIIGLITLTSCSVIKSKPKSIELRTYWGNKTEVIDFLNSDKAKAERWLVQAVGE